MLSLEPAEAALVVHLAGQVSSLLQAARSSSTSGGDSTGVAGSTGGGSESAGGADAEAPVDPVVGPVYADVPTPADPALRRLLPDAYADEESSREFRRFTSDDLSTEKMANLARMVDDIRSATPRVRSRDVELSTDSIGAWLRALTDLRLVLASRLGMDADGEVPSAGAPGVHDVYDWLGLVQESILDATGY